jgi:hypothetical protein
MTWSAPDAQRREAQVKRGPSAPQVEQDSAAEPGIDDAPDEEDRAAKALRRRADFFPQRGQGAASFERLIGSSSSKVSSHGSQKNS